ncbi:MAG: flagellar hook-length control protein FliK [Clostridiales Family XIII bacterium]|nr:flagellar hook-length control protein FliK [Clostridiales Family XIII bacterium]
MDVNLIGGTTGAQTAANAANATGADAALFQNMIAAALLQNGGAVLDGTAGLTPGAPEGDAAGADPALLMRLLLGGAFASAKATDALGAEAARGSLLAIVAGTPAEELLAASGDPDAAETAELLAETLASLDAAKIARAETVSANAEAAGTTLSPALAGAMKPLLAAAMNETGAARGSLLAIVAGTPAEELLAASGNPDAAKTAELLADALVTADAPETGAALDPGGVAGEANGAFAAKADARDTLVNAARESGTEREAGKAGGTSAQDGISARGLEAGARPAQAQSAEKPAPYGQIAREVFAALANKNVPTVLSMRLEPAELGRIDVSMKLTKAGKLMIDIAAENARTQALLAGQTDKLVQALGLQNVQVESVSAAANSFVGQQLAQGYADRGTPFFMDLASGGREKDAEQDGGEKSSGGGQAAAGIPAEEAAPGTARYARLMDLTA